MTTYFGRAWVFAVIAIVVPALYWLGAKYGILPPRYVLQVAYGTVALVSCAAVYVYGVSRWSPYAAPKELTGTEPVKVKTCVIVPAPAAVNDPPLGRADGSSTTATPASPPAPPAPPPEASPQPRKP